MAIQAAEEKIKLMEARAEAEKRKVTTKAKMKVIAEAKMKAIDEFRTSFDFFII